jgi:hypothetical protein
MLWRGERERAIPAEKNWWRVTAVVVCRRSEPWNWANSLASVGPMFVGKYVLWRGQKHWNGLILLLAINFSWNNVEISQKYCILLQIQICHCLMNNWKNRLAFAIVKKCKTLINIICNAMTNLNWACQIRSGWTKWN